MKVLGIDPGPEDSGIVLFDSIRQQVLSSRMISWAALMVSLHNRGTATETTEALAIEAFSPYGTRLGYESMQTISNAGKFEAAWTLAGRGPCVAVSRPTVKLHLCDSRRVGDPEVRDALVHRFGPGRKLAVGTMAKPGPLYGIKGHLWAALAVAVTAADEGVDTGS